MENPFENIEKKEKYKQIMLPQTLINRLKSMNKGSMRQTIEFLMGSNVNLGLNNKIKIMDDEIVKIQETIEKLVSINGLRI